MNLKQLSSKEFEYFSESDINELIIESLYPLESKEARHYTNPINSRIPTIISKNGLHYQIYRLGIIPNKNKIKTKGGHYINKKYNN